MTTIEIPSRQDVDPKFKWDVAQLYANDDDWQADFVRCRRMITEGASFQGRLKEGWQVMRDFLNWQEESSRLLEMLYLYAAMRRDEDNGNAQYQALVDRMENLAVTASCTTAFFAPEVLALPEEQLESYLSQPEMAVYRRFFNDVTRMRAHTLSPAEEKLLAGTGEMASGFQNVYSLFTNADMEFPAITNERGEREQLTAGNFVPFLRSKNRAVRKEAFTAKYETYARYGNTIAALYANSVKKDNFYATTSKFSGALAASLFADNVEERVYRNLIDSVHAHLPEFHAYLDVRRNLLGVEKLHMYDVYVPLFPEPTQNYDWEQGKRIVLAGLAPLGDEYCRTLSDGLDGGWCDVYENKGKTSGAYSTGCYGSEPYILLNYKDDLNSVFTLAHEAGHSMHSFYSRRKQPYIYSDYRIFVAEVASTVNENLLIRYLLSRAESKDEVLYLTNHYLEEFRTTVIRQTMFAEFELLTHEAAARGEALTAPFLCDMYLQLNKDYFGPAVESDDLIAWEWARIPHFYRAFYVYKYATGFCAATALAQGILTDDKQQHEENLGRYLEFLSGGCSKDPLDLLADAGVDMRKPTPVEQGFKLFFDLLGGLN